jgi:predicted component of type VI protein secretion system
MSETKLVPQLVELTGPHSGRAHALPYGEHIVGRGAGASIALEDKDVSRRHARLEVGPDGVLVHDLGSKNGVYADGHRIEGSILLTHGSILAFGDLQLSVVHPASQVSKALLAAGEATMTVTRTEEREGPAVMSLLLPVLGVVLFAGMMIAYFLL